LYHALPELFRSQGLPSATVTRGIAGFRGGGPIRSLDSVDLGSPLPVRVEVVGPAEAIVKRARQLDLAGATVTKGILGYGAHKRIHKHKTLTLSKDDPLWSP
jgi:PII-like signaling protein